MTGDWAVPRHLVRDVVSVMMSCGTYDAAGQWANEVGIPAESGVSGGIAHGNSVRGVALCLRMTRGADAP